MDGKALISVQGQGIAILQGQLPDVTGPWCVQLGVAQEEADCMGGGGGRGKEGMGEGGGHVMYHVMDVWWSCDGIM